MADRVRSVPVLLDKICRTLEAEGIAFVKLGGVVPNPRLVEST